MNRALPTPTQSAETLASLHEGCFVCGRNNPLGLRTLYVQESGGSTLARVRCDRVWAGYPGSLHGGITTALLDGAMVHCLFARGVVAVTARISVEFLGPVVLAEELTVGAHFLSGRHGVYQLQAELSQLDRARATATGMFVKMHGCELGPSRWRPARSSDCPREDEP